MGQIGSAVGQTPTVNPGLQSLYAYQLENSIFPFGFLLSEIDAFETEKGANALSALRNGMANPFFKVMALAATAGNGSEIRDAKIAEEIEQILNNRTVDFALVEKVQCTTLLQELEWLSSPIDPKVALSNVAADISLSSLEAICVFQGQLLSSHFSTLNDFEISVSSSLAAFANVSPSGSLEISLGLLIKILERVEELSYLFTGSTLSEIVFLPVLSMDQNILRPTWTTAFENQKNRKYEELEKAAYGTIFPGLEFDPEIDAQNILTSDYWRVGLGAELVEYFALAVLFVIHHERAHADLEQKQCSAGIESRADLQGASALINSVEQTVGKMAAASNQVFDQKMPSLAESAILMNREGLDNLRMICEQMQGVMKQIDQIGGQSGITAPGGADLSEMCKNPDAYLKREILRNHNENPIFPEDQMVQFAEHQANSAVRFVILSILTQLDKMEGCSPELASERVSIYLRETKEWCAKTAPSDIEQTPLILQSYCPVLSNLR